MTPTAKLVADLATSLETAIAEPLSQADRRNCAALVSKATAHLHALQDSICSADAARAKWGVRRDELLTGETEAQAAGLMLTKILQDFEAIVPVVHCAFCGIRYTYGTSEHQRALLTAHIQTCNKHPMRETSDRIAALESSLQDMITCVQANDVASLANATTSAQALLV